MCKSAFFSKMGEKGRGIAGSQHPTAGNHSCPGPVCMYVWCSNTGLAEGERAHLLEVVGTPLLLLVECPLLCLHILFLTFLCLLWHHITEQTDTPYTHAHTHTNTTLSLPLQISCYQLCIS